MSEEFKVEKSIAYAAQRANEAHMILERVELRLVALEVLERIEASPWGAIDSIQKRLGRLERNSLESHPVGPGSVAPQNRSGEYQGILSGMHKEERRRHLRGMVRDGLLTASQANNVEPEDDDMSLPGKIMTTHINLTMQEALQRIARDETLEAVTAGGFVVTYCNNGGFKNSSGYSYCPVLGDLQTTWKVRRRS